MSKLFTHNAYRILGLDTSVEIKDILRRSKEIDHRLNIEDTPQYDFDIGILDNVRTQTNVREAAQNIQNPKKKIKENFFWFRIIDDIDEQAIKSATQGDYQNAIRIWQNASEIKSAKSFFYKKNLAILFCLILLEEDNKGYLRDSIAVWKELVDSNKFWVQFIKDYEARDDTANQDFLSKFKSKVANYLADFYTDLHELYKDSAYINEFQEAFSVRGTKIEKSILNPAFQTINNVVENLESMNVSEDGVLDKDETSQIKEFIDSLQSELNKLIKLGLYEDSQTKTMRDRAANAIRTIVLDIHNNLSELQKSEGLLEVAIKLAGTESLKSKLSGELKQIQKNIKDDAENVVVIEIPGTFRNNTVVFKSAFVEYNKKRIFFKDATSYSFDSTATSHSVYGVPTGTSYVYNWSVVSEKETISISLTARKDESNAKEDWAKLVGLTASLIEPFIVKRIVEQIFDRGEIVKFGEVEFTKKGYSKMKFKFFKKNEKLMVNWSDTIYIPKMYQGQVILWEDKSGESSQFASIPMSTPNAVILPALVQACYERYEK